MVGPLATQHLWKDFLIDPQSNSAHDGTCGNPTNRDDSFVVLKLQNLEFLPC